MDFFLVAALFVLLFIIELVYFKVADKYNIIDQPNHRSSHATVTIRGGGIIFSIALLIGAIYWGWAYGYFLTGLLLISFISFVDDIKPTSNKTRITFHLLAVVLLFYQLGMYELPLYWIALGFIFVIGTINAINFMDGINGITGGYALITLLTLWYINTYVILFTNENYLTLPIVALLVFNFFNFRKKAKCFAGDIGSVSIAFIILFFLLQLIIKTQNLNYILILLVYGLDTATTILFRIVRRENVFEAHRSHFYQFLANEKKIPHLWVVALYVLAQGIINAVVIKYLPVSAINLLMLMAATGLLFFLMRLMFEGPKKLFAIKE